MMVSVLALLLAPAAAAAGEQPAAGAEGPARASVIIVSPVRASESRWRESRDERGEGRATERSRTEADGTVVTLRTIEFE